MPITVESFGGRVGWLARKIVPGAASWGFTKLMFLLRRKETIRFIDTFLRDETPMKPLSIALETINRCNSTCGFCPCNVNDEARPFKRMTDETFQLLTQQLVSWGYTGRIVMNVNNEPFMDSRIIERTKRIREHLPEANIYLITNGTLLTLDKFRQIAPFLDRININNYSNEMRLHDNIREIVSYVTNTPDEFAHITIDVQYRYLNEVLSNRNGTAPNKPVASARRDEVHEPCLEPYTCMYIYPDGTVGLCCYDALEKISLGNCGEKTLAEIWSSGEYTRIRELMRKKRSGYAFCKYCDGFSKMIRTKLSSGQKRPPA